MREIRFAFLKYLALNLSLHLGFPTRACGSTTTPHCRTYAIMRSRLLAHCPAAPVNHKVCGQATRASPRPTWWGWQTSPWPGGPAKASTALGSPACRRRAPHHCPCSYLAAAHSQMRHRSRCGNKKGDCQQCPTGGDSRDVVTGSSSFY